MPASTGRSLGSVPSSPGSLVRLVHLSRATGVGPDPTVGADDPPPDTVGSTSTHPALLLTIEEAAERLQVGRCTMQALLLSGEVQSFKIGRLRRVPPAALDAYPPAHGAVIPASGAPPRPVNPNSRTA